MTMGPTGRKAREIQTMPDVKRVGLATGFATLGSGTTSIVASTSLVASHSHISATFQVGSFGAISSNQGGIVIRSLSLGVGIVFGTLTAVAYPWDTIIHWTISDTKS